MYMQKYSESDTRVHLPDNYGGNAIFQGERVSLGTAEVKKPSVDHAEEPQLACGPPNESKNPWEAQANTEESQSASATPRPAIFDKFKGLGGVFDALPLRSLFAPRREGCEGDGLSLGIEEIMIIAIAAMLFFSKNGDKECAIILLALLLIR